MNTTPDVSNEKITGLQNIILEHASVERDSIVSEGRREAETWLSKEMAKLTKEMEQMVNDAKARSEEIKRRQILSAEREKQTEGLRQQNRLLSEAMKKFTEELVKLRNRDDYIDILSALALSSASSLKGGAPVKLRLAALDSSFGDEIARRVNEKFPEAAMTFDHASVPILGGCWVESADGKRQINADWQSRTQEVADSLADRLLALL